LSFIDPIVHRFLVSLIFHHHSITLPNHHPVFCIWVLFPKLPTNAGRLEIQIKKKYARSRAAYSSKILRCGASINQQKKRRTSNSMGVHSQ